MLRRGRAACLPHAGRLPADGQVGHPLRGQKRPMLPCRSQSRNRLLALHPVLWGVKGRLWLGPCLLCLRAWCTESRVCDMTGLSPQICYLKCLNGQGGRSCKASGFLLTCAASMPSHPHGWLKVQYCWACESALHIRSQAWQSYQLWLPIFTLGRRWRYWLGGTVSGTEARMSRR